MTWEMWVLLSIAAYIICGLVYSTGLRCWWRGQHDSIRMSVSVSRRRPGEDRATPWYKETVWHCRWCGHREPVKWGTQTWTSV